MVTYNKLITVTAGKGHALSLQRQQSTLYNLQNIFIGVFIGIL
jgi:hypothetical protein